MGKKNLKLGLAVLALLLVLAGLSLLVYKKYGKKAAVIETGPPKTARQLRRLVKRISSLDAPACNGISGKKGDPNQLWLDCFKQAYEEPSLRIYGIDDPKLVPELIKIAARNKFRVPRQVPDDNIIRKNYRLLMCSIRFTAVQTLGKINDPRAVDPLIKIMDEPYDTDCVGCFFGGATSVCTVAGKEAAKFKDPGIEQKLLKNIESHPYRTEDDVNEAVEKKKAGETIGMEDAWMEYQDKNIVECNIEALARRGAQGRKIIFQKIKSGDLTSAQLQLFLLVMSRFPIDQESFELFKKYLSYENKAVQDKAAEALARGATKQRKDFYLSFYEQGRYKDAAIAFGRIKTPDLVPQLTEIIKKSDDLDTLKEACVALKEFKPEEIRPALPALLSKMKNNQEMLTNEYYDVLKKAKDPSVIKELAAMLHDPRMTMGIQVDTIGTIGGLEAKAALRKILEEKNFAQNVAKGMKASPEEEKDTLDRLQRIRFRAMFWVMVLEGESAKPYCAGFFGQKAVDAQWPMAEAKRKQL